MLTTGTEKRIVQQAAACIASRIFRAIEKQGYCALVLAGGNSPRELYRLLADGVPVSAMQEQGVNVPETAAVSASGGTTVQLPWQSVMLFWGDERCVPENHDESNFSMACASLITPTDIPKRNLFPMPHVTENHETAARHYEQKLKQFFERHEHCTLNAFPVFDIILLGMGADGHTASLFPENRKALEEKNRWVIAVDAKQGSPPGFRLSLTLPVINNARSVLFFVTGKDKESMVHDITSGKRPDLPAARVKPEDGELIWFYGKG
ncbi:MAG: 6-phosphogluconolactonase [Prosthecochloris sp.]|nr:6-phosphogluconolactonase [Prosthecochloris sp.]